MKLKHTLSIALGGYTINLIVDLLCTFLFNGEMYQTVYRAYTNNSSYTFSCSNISTLFYIFLFLGCIFFITSLLKMKKNIKLQPLATITAVLFGISLAYNLMLQLWHLSAILGGKGEVNVYFWSFGFNGIMSWIDWLAHLGLLIMFACMKNLMPMTRIIAIVACLFPILHLLAGLFGIDVYAPMISQTYIITNGMLWCTMLLLLCMNSDLLEENASC